MLALAAHLALLLDLALALGQANGPGTESGRKEDITTVFENHTHRGRGSLHCQPKPAKQPQALEGTNPNPPFPSFPCLQSTHDLVKEHTLTVSFDIRDTSYHTLLNLPLFCTCTVSPANAIAATAMRAALSCDIGYPISPQTSRHFITLETLNTPLGPTLSISKPNR